MTIWSEDLSDAQLKMLIASGERDENGGYGVELSGSAAWRVARNLVAMELGYIEGGKQNGSNLPGLFFGNSEAVQILHEFDDEPEECPICGMAIGHFHDF